MDSFTLAVIFAVVWLALVALYCLFRVFGGKIIDMIRCDCFTGPCCDCWGLGGQIDEHDREFDELQQSRFNQQQQQAQLPPIIIVNGGGSDGKTRNRGNEYSSSSSDDDDDGGGVPRNRKPQVSWLLSSKKKEDVRDPVIVV